MIPKEILKKVRRLEIRTRSLVDELFSGEYGSVFKGRGMDFAEVREYQSGDDIRTIDWNVTARTGRLHVKKYQEERELTVMLMVDASSSGEFGSVNQLKGELAVEICALLAFSAIKNQDRVGLLIFTDRVEKYIPPKKGRNHVLRVLRELFYFRPQGRGTRVGVALEHIQHVVRRRGILFLISDFMDQDFATPLRVANKRHDVVAISITDPRETALPDVGLIELEDAETGETVLVDTRARGVRDAFARRSAAQRGGRDQVFRGCGVDSIELFTDRSYVEPLNRFFAQRARRLR